MAGHAQLKLVMTECSKTQIRLTGLIYSPHTRKKTKEDALVVPQSFVNSLSIAEKQSRHAHRSINDIHISTGSLFLMLFDYNARK